jgi:glycosyltransferase involved in cell wall biosynthesis
MKVSIVTVCLNNVSTIEQTIKSVFMQKKSDIEYIVIDGGSTDGTIEIIDKYKDDISYFISEPDRGIYAAMNKGIKAATGQILAFLNADDFYTDESVVSDIITFILDNSFDAAYADLDYVKAEDPNKIVRCWKSGEYKKNAFRKGWVPPHPTFFCRKEIFQKYGAYLDSFKIAADFELMLRFMERHNIKTGYLPKVIVRMRIGGKANNIFGILKGNMEILNAFRINQIPISPLFFCIKPVAKFRQLFYRE